MIDHARDYEILSIWFSLFRKFEDDELFRAFVRDATYRVRCVRRIINHFFPGYTRMCNVSTMIISKADQFLFLRMGMTFLASGKNKDRVISSIGRLCRMLRSAKVVKGEQNYVWLQPSIGLHKTIAVVFDNTFVGCDRTWIDMSAEVKFSLIISTIWNKCFNSLWKLSLAIKNDNVWESDAMLSRDLAVGVREYEGRALNVLAKSITNCLEKKTELAQQTEPSMELVKVTPYHVQEVNDLRQSLKSSQREIVQLQLKLADGGMRNRNFESFKEYENTTKDIGAVDLKSLKTVEKGNESLRTNNPNLTKLIEAEMSRKIEQDTLVSSGQFAEMPLAAIALKESVNRLITRLEKSTDLIRKQASNIVNTTDAQPEDVGKVYKFFERFDDITGTRIGDIIEKLASMEDESQELEREFTAGRETSSRRNQSQ